MPVAKKKSSTKSSRRTPQSVAREPRAGSANVLVYSGSGGYWYAQAYDAKTGKRITDASDYSRDGVLRELRRKFPMIGVEIESVVDRNPYVEQPTQTEIERDVTRLRYLPGTNIPTIAEGRRLDDLTSYNDTILLHLHGDDLDLVLRRLLPRQGRGDYGYRMAALQSIHPDDLVEALVKHGMTLQRFGIESIRR